MPDNEESKLPKVSDGQFIGRLADKVFRVNTPNSWLIDSLSGDNDFGLDYQVQIQSGSLISECFRVQLKGTTEPRLNQDKSFFSISIKISTVNYYARITEPILLVLCDLSVDTAQPKNCPLYYLWIHDDIKRIRIRGTTDGQSSVTFLIPSSNLLLESTDLSQDLANFRSLAKVGEQLDSTLQGARPSMLSNERSDLISRAANGIAQRSPNLLEALAQNPMSSWVDAPHGTLQWYLNEAMVALGHGDAETASKVLNSAEEIAKLGKEIEQADYWHVVGRYRSYLLDDSGAKDAFEKACILSLDSPKHLVPWAESTLRSTFRVDASNEFRDVIDRLSSNDPAVVGMRARLQAAEGRYMDAMETAKNLSGANGNFSRAIILGMQSRSEELIPECDAGLSLPEVPATTRLALLVLRARGRFSLAIGGIPAEGFDSELPMTGPSGANPEHLRAAWSDIQGAVRILQATGWTGNTDLIADIWAATAAMLGFQRASLPLMADAASRRPEILSLQESVESIAAQVGEFETALEANGRQPHSDKRALRRTALLHLVSRHKECVEFFLLHENSIATGHGMYGYSIGMAIDSAERIVRPDLAKRWIEKLEGLPNQAANLAILRFMRAMNQNRLARDSALIELEKNFEALGRPQTIAIQLFQEYDSTLLYEASRCVEVAEQIGKERLFDVDGTLHLAQAFITLGMWSHLLELSDQSGSRFDTNDRISAIGSIALDHLGRSAEAHERLHRIIENPGADPLALKTYITIASRSGFTLEAVNCLERVLAIESTPIKRLECLKYLFELIQLTEPTSPRLVDIAWEMGACSDRLDEVQEGLFLMSMFWATLPEDVLLEDSRKVEFQCRLENYIQRFPDSRILKRVSLPEGAGAEQFIQSLKELSGVTEEHVRWRAKIQEELRRGLTAVPYAWRPRNILDGIPDLPTLWGMSKRSKWDDRQLHLTMTQAGWEAVPYATMRGRVPLLDLVTLLVVFDLGLIDDIFKIFPKIAISKGTLIELQGLLSPFKWCPFRDTILGLQNALKVHFAAIEQPHVEPPEGGHQSPLPWSSEEVSQIAKTSKFLLYSDDFVFRSFALLGNSSAISICTMDVLHALDAKGALPAALVASHIATLATWRVGLTVSIRYQLAVLPDALSSASSIEGGIRILQADTLCNGLFTRLWDYSKAFPELLGYGGALLRELVTNPCNKGISVQSFVGFWLSKVRLHPKSAGKADDILALMIVYALRDPYPLDEKISRCVWGIYHSMIEFIYGDFMDEEKYRNSLSTVGRVSAIMDHHQKLQGEISMQHRISIAMNSGTSDYDRFTNTYGMELLRLKQSTKS